MLEPVFTREEAFSLTFSEDQYFFDLAENAELIVERLHLGRDEAGILDKKLDASLLHTVSRIIEFLHDPEYKDEAERELAVRNEPDVAIAILRHAFRIRSSRVNDLLVRKLTDLCQFDQDGIAKQAIREASGSELQRLSQLADDAFLNVGTADELYHVAADPRRTLGIRIRACHLLIDRHRRVDAVPIALGLFAEGAKLPDIRQLLERLSKAFGGLETLDAQVVHDDVVSPLIECLQRYERNTDVRRYLLWAIGELYEPVLSHVRETSIWQIDGRDMWLALALRQCAFHTSAAAQLMIDWMRNWEVDDRFRLELARRLKHKRIKLPEGAVDALTGLLDELPYRYEREMRTAIESVIQIANEDRPQRPAEIYNELLGQYHGEEGVDEDLVWKFRFAPGGLNYLRNRLNQMNPEELDLLIEILYHERFSGRWTERLNILLDAFPRLDTAKRRDVLQIVYQLARNEPKASRGRQNANEFLAGLVDAGDDDSELARQYWQKLGEEG
jgi:hypothetical protein